MNKKHIILLASLVITMGYSVKSYAATSLNRIAGADRYKTAVEVSTYGWENGSDYAVLTTGQNYPDAICAAPLASRHRAPILLTEKSNINPDTKAELQRLKTKYVYIIGGTNVISSDVDKQLKDLGIKIFRIAGSDRYETSLKIAEQLGSSEEAFIVTGTDYADALSVDSIAATKMAPVILVPKDHPSESLSQYMNSKLLTHTYIIGGTDLISDTLIKGFPNKIRITGDDKYKRNAAVLSFFKEDYDYTDTYIASGENFADALSGSVLAASTQSPIILTGAAAEENTIAVLNNNISSIHTFQVLGGEKAVESSTLQSMIYKGNPYGLYDGQNYVNQMAGFSLSIQSDWSDYSSNYSDDDLVELFSFSKYPWTQENADKNYTFSCYSAQDGSFTGTDYLSKLQSYYENMGVTLHDTSSKKTVGGHEFTVIDGSEATTFTHFRIYLLNTGSSTIIFETAYNSDEEVNTVEDVLKTLTLTNVIK